jgi:hypothetical protein
VFEKSNTELSAVKILELGPWQKIRGLAAGIFDRQSLKDKLFELIDDKGIHVNKYRVNLIVLSTGTGSILVTFINEHLKIH